LHETPYSKTFKNRINIDANITEYYEQDVVTRIGVFVVVVPTFFSSSFQTKDELNDLMARVFAEGLEGLVIKMNDSVYEPGKRHWIKIKKDYLAEGAMADSADLVVLGAYFGTGNKGGMMSVFLMGAFDPAIDQFCTVTKCANGFDDRTLLRLQKQLKMIKISKDYSKVPSWLNVARSMVPDFVVADPKAAPVWEITGAEFSRSGFHTAGTTTDHEGISIRFPRVTRQRPDKSWKEATDVPRLESLFKASRSQSDWSRKLEALSNPSPANKRAAQRDEVLASAKKPRLFRVRESAQFNYLRPLLEGFVINVPGALIGDESFQMLYRRLVACGAVVTGDGLRETTKPVTHTIVVPPNTNPASSLDGVTPLTVDWLEKSINEGKLQPLPANQPQICEM
uniref:BRCT domain-containing protein n=2 Tax=Mesocestoides corti TaxID=53468 RepID=A0A5K3FPH4_MESCO